MSHVFMSNALFRCCCCYSSTQAVGQGFFVQFLACHGDCQSDGLDLRLDCSLAKIDHEVWCLNDYCRVFVLFSSSSSSYTGALLDPAIGPCCISHPMYIYIGYFYYACIYAARQPFQLIQLFCYALNQTEHLNNVSVIYIFFSYFFIFWFT